MEGQPIQGPVRARYQEWAPCVKDAAILNMARRCPSPRLGSRSPLAARGKRVAPESCRAGHLHASSPLRSAVRHGLVDSRLAPPRNWPRAAASRRFPPFPARTGPTQARTAGLSSRPPRLVSGFRHMGVPKRLKIAEIVGDFSAKSPKMSAICLTNGKAFW